MIKRARHRLFIMPHAFRDTVLSKCVWSCCAGVHQTAFTPPEPAHNAGNLMPQRPAEVLIDDSSPCLSECWPASDTLSPMVGWRKSGRQTMSKAYCRACEVESEDDTPRARQAAGNDRKTSAQDVCSPSSKERSIHCDFKRPFQAWASWQRRLAVANKADGGQRSAKKCDADGMGISKLKYKGEVTCGSSLENNPRAAATKAIKSRTTPDCRFRQ